MEEDFLFEEPGVPYNIKHRAYFFAREVIRLVGKCKYDRVYSSLFDQLVRSSTSIGANILEGSSGSSKKDWQKYMNIALKSGKETLYWLSLIRDTMEVDTENVKSLIKEASEITNIVASILLKSKTGRS